MISQGETFENNRKFPAEWTVKYRCWSCEGTFLQGASEYKPCPHCGSNDRWIPDKLMKLVAAAPPGTVMIEDERCLSM